MNSKLKTIYEERSKLYNCSPSRFESEGITVLEVESLRGKDYFTLALFDKHVFIRVDPEMEHPFDKNKIFNATPLEVLKLIEDHYGASDRKFEKTYCYYYYLKDESLENHSELAIERITDKNSDKLDVFLSSLSEEEIDLADIELDNLDPVIFGGFVNDDMKCYVSHRYPRECTGIADIGIVIDQNQRGNGFGKAMLIHEVNWCLKNNVIPMYVVLESNKPSTRLVQSLGFEKFCEIYMLE